MNEQIIAKLVGVLNFKVNTSGLTKFQQAMKQTQTKMAAMSRQAEALQKKLGAKLGIKPVDTANQAKLDKSIRASLDRQIKLETQMNKAKSQTFRTELAGQKLQFAQAKTAAFQTSTALKDRMAMAVIAAKESRAAEASLKAQGQAIKNTATLEQAKTRQARLEALHAQTVQRTNNLEAQRQKTLTATQRLEQTMQQARERGHQAAMNAIARQAAAKTRAQRADVAFQQRQQQFDWKTARQAQWQANQDARRDAPAGDTTILGLGKAGLGLAAGVYAVTKAADYLKERVNQRQEAASNSQQFSTALYSAGGKSLDNQRIAKDRYYEINEKYGTEVSLDGAKDYAKFIQGQLSLGKTLTQATKVFEDQQATFRAAALNAQAQKRAAYQLSQIRAKGRPEGADVNDLGDAVGAPVMSAIRAAAVERLRAKIKPEEQAGWFKAQVTAGKILAKDFDVGMANFLKANQDLLKKQMQSVNAAQQRVDNQVFINDTRRDSSLELNKAVLDNIAAHKQLNEAMQPLKNAFQQLDISLTNFSAFLIRFAIGKNADGTDKSPQQQMQDRMSTQDLPVDTAMVGTHDYSAIDGNTQHQGGWVGNFWNHILGIKTPDPLAPKPEAPEAEQWLKVFRDAQPPQPMSASDIVGRATSRALSEMNGNSIQPTQGNAQDVAPSVINNNNTTNVAPAQVTINVNAPEGVSAQEVARLVDDKVKTGLVNELQRYMPKDSE